MKANATVSVTPDRSTSFSAAVKLKPWTLIIPLLILLAAVSALHTPAFGALAPAPGGVGIPIDPHGFPAFYMDTNGLALEPCLPPPAGNATFGDGSMCIYDPLDPDSALVVAGEIFWWMGEAQMGMPGGGDAILVLGIEGTFGGTEAPIDGQQISFGRVRIRVDVPVAGTYTVIHPYGTMTFENVTVEDGINYTADLGAANFLNPVIGFNGTLNSTIGPFLTWPDYLNDATLQLRALDPVTNEPIGPVLEQYVGNPGVPHVVTGSPSGNNFFRVEGPAGSNLDGQGNDFVQTDLFSVMGKVYDPSKAVTAHVFPGVPDKKLFAVGPVNRENFFNPDIVSTGTVTGVDHFYSVGYPIWYQENIGTIEAPAGGLMLTLCTPGDPMCISDPINPLDPVMTALRTGGEGFYWSADARIDLGGGDRALLVLGLESTFGGDESIVDGQQITFGRVRIRVDVPQDGTYTVTHPYGEIVFENVTAADGINYTADIGIIDPEDPDGAFQGTLYSDIGPTVLKWTTFNSDTSLTDPLLIKPNAFNPALNNYYVGDPGIEHQVTGSPTGNNFFRVQGPGLNVQTDLFAVSGKIYDPQTFEFSINALAPVAVEDAAELNLAQAAAVTINVLANDTIVAPATLATLTVLPAGEAFGPEGGAVTVNANNTVTYTPNAGFSGTDTFGYRIADSNGLSSNIAVVTVTVIPVETITISRARLDLRRLRWDIRGTSTFDGTTLTIHAGPTEAGPVIGTATVDNGRWSLRATTTTNPDVTSISIVSSSAGGTTLRNQPLQVR